MKEADTRDWLRKCGFTIHWLEPSFGSSVGLADCLLECSFGSIPVELKWWNETKFGLKQYMRPAQIRYHVMSAREGKHTAILYGVQFGSKVKAKFYMIPGRYCPLSPYEGTNEDKHWEVGEWFHPENNVVIKTLDDNSFWFGE